MDFVIDIHAHSVATNGFMYCNAVQEGSDLALVSMIVSRGHVVTFQFCNLVQTEREGVFPKLLDSNSSDFSFQQTRFDNDPSKEGTGRR